MKNHNSGFTLVELMVTVAIVGVLATLALPQYKRYQYRSIQNEAKSALLQMYVAEKSFSVEKSSYTVCLKQQDIVLSRGSRIILKGITTQPRCS